MNDTAQVSGFVFQLVGSVEPSACLRDDVRSKGWFQGSTLERHPLHQVRDTFTLEVLHDQDELAVLFRELVDVYDIGMMDPRDDTRLVDEHLPDAVLLRQVREDPLQHHGTLEPTRADDL